LVLKQRGEASEHVANFQAVAAMMALASLERFVVHGFRLAEVLQGCVQEGAVVELIGHAQGVASKEL
jgi:hypothetical protein